MKVLVTGGRDYQGRAEVFAALDRLRPSHIAHGACSDREGNLIGTDRWADEWADERFVPCRRYYADWSQGRRAGPIRNSFALKDFEPECVLASPGGAGTADMVGKANKAGVPVEFV